jgi:hypothetical protein
MLTTEENYSIRQSNFSLIEELHLDNDGNIEELSMIWFDANIRQTDDYLEMIDTLRSITNDLKLFDNIDERMNCINSIIADEIFFIVSGQFNE